MHNGLGGASAQNITILQRLEIAEQAIYKITEEATANEGRNENPSFAPDGAHIVYACQRGRQSQIWVMNADGTGKHPLTQAGSNEKPVWVNAEK